MKKYQFVAYTPETSTQTQNTVRIINKPTIPQPHLTKSFSEESDSPSPSLTSSTDNIFHFSGSKRTLSALSSAQEPAVKETALLLNPEQTQPHRLSIHSIIHPASQNPAPELRTQNIVDLTGDDTTDLTNDYNAYPKPNFEALTHVPVAHNAINPITHGITASSPSKNGLTTKITISSSTEFPNSESQAITQYCQQKATQINNNITNSNRSPTNPFVDPTYDAAFKYLFRNLELAKNFIHSALGLNDINIISIEPMNVHLSELIQGNQYNDKQASLAVDGLFQIETDQPPQKNQPQNNKMLVFLEMQRKRFPGFFERQEAYATLILTNELEKGVANHYTEISKVVGIIIGWTDLIPQQTPYALKSLSREWKALDGTNINIPLQSLINMHVFELAKFRKHPDSLKINKHSPSILQWLSFMIECGKAQSIPDWANDVIETAYKHMKREDIIPEIRTLIEASIIKAQLEENARNQELIDTAKIAETKGKVESAVGTILNLLNISSINKEIIAQAVAGQFNKQQVDAIVDYITKQQNPPVVNNIIRVCNLLGDPLTDNEEVPTQDLTDTMLLSDNSWVLNAVDDEETKERDINDSPLPAEDALVNSLGGNEYHEVAELLLGQVEFPE